MLNAGPIPPFTTSTPPFIPFGAAPQSQAVFPQDFDFGQFAQQLAGQAAQALPGIIMSLLSSHPVIGPAIRQQGVAPQGGFGIQTPMGPFGVGWSSASPQPGGVTPQGFDFGQFAQQLAGQAAQALPGIIMSLLSSHPVIGPAMKQQGVAPQGGFGIQTPIGPFGVGWSSASPQPGGVTPQGFDFGQFAQQLAGQAAQALPGIIMSLLSSHPVIGPAIRQQGVAPQGGFGIQTPIGPFGVGWSSASPQPGGVTPQGFDFGQFAQQLAGQAAQALPGIIMSLLSSHPVIGPAIRQQGVAPQGGFGIQTPIGPFGVGWSSASPQPGGVTPQGFDFGQFAQQLAGQAAQALPGIIMSLLSSHPVIGPAMKQQGVAPQGGFGAPDLSGILQGTQNPFQNLGPLGPIWLWNSASQQPGGVAPQGFDFGQFAQQLAGQAAQALPGIILSLLSSHPVVGPAMRQQGMAPRDAASIH